MPAVILSPQLTRRLRRRRLVPNIRLQCRLVQHQSLSCFFLPHQTPTKLKCVFRLKRSRAIDPFESSSMANPRATGLVDNWRTKIQSPLGTLQPRSVTLNLRTPTHGPPRSSSASMVSVSSSSTLSVSYIVAHHLLADSLVSSLGMTCCQLSPSQGSRRELAGFTPESRTSLHTFGQIFVTSSSIMLSNGSPAQSPLGQTQMWIPRRRCTILFILHSLLAFSIMMPFITR